MTKIFYQIMSDFLYHCNNIYHCIVIFALNKVFMKSTFLMLYVRLSLTYLTAPSRVSCQNYGFNFYLFFLS